MFHKANKLWGGTGNTVTPTVCRVGLAPVNLEGVILTGASRCEHAVVQTLSIILQLFFIKCARGSGLEMAILAGRYFLLQFKRTQRTFLKTFE